MRELSSSWLDDADLPPEAPLAMPEQDFYRGRSIERTVDRSLLARRLFLIGGSAAIGLAASLSIADLLALNGFDLVDQLIALISLLLFAWTGFGFLNAAVGLATSLLDRSKCQPAHKLPTKPVAILLPVYNEDMAAVAARIGRMTAELTRLGGRQLFHLFVLSDSAASAEAPERAACRALQRRGECPIFYRRRSHNEGRKPGNIAEWVRRFGAGYEAMIILDADSRMSGTALLRLAAAIDDDPTLGLIQTTPLLTAGESLFARWQQFAAMFYGPIASAGLHWWSGNEATFWGHNAILRVRAFAESCGLPNLPGAAPLGGTIMSHDMVEAALLRRRGWKCRLMLLPDGSYEECPPTLADHAIRDRRWCQGNLQHLRILDAAGLHWVSRLQLLMGASAYLTSPLWLILLATGLCQSLRTGAPVVPLGSPAWLIAGTLVLLFGTKLMALLWAACDNALVRRLGGWRRVALGVAADLPLSILSAPIVMASQCFAIIEIVAGRPSGWSAQRRSANNMTLAEAFERYSAHVFLGLPFWIAAMADLGTGIWQMPVAIGLLGAPLFVALTSRSDWGAAAARYGIFSADPAAVPSFQHAGIRPALKGELHPI